MIVSFHDRSPCIAPDVFVAPDAWVIGDVTLGARSSVFFHAVLRGDLESIVIGERSNIQDHAIIHTTKGRCGVTIGSDVTVGHRATLHSTTVHSRSLIGMGAVLLDESEIGEESLVGAAALVTEGKKFPPRSLILGSPARLVRTLSAEEVQRFQVAAQRYVDISAVYSAMPLK